MRHAKKREESTGAAGRRRASGIKAAVACLCLALIQAAGCASGRVNLAGTDGPGARTEIVGSIGYDAKGLPVPGAPLAERPDGPGSHFTLVRLLKNRPLLSCDVAVVRASPDFSRPIKAVYEWTGKGFVLGMNMTSAMAGSGGVHASGRDAVLELAIVLTPVAAGTVGGFVVGLVNGLRAAVEELGRMVTTDEQMISCTAYEYDGLNRLRFMHMYVAGRPQEAVRTEFEYQGSGIVPIKAVVRDLAAGAERVVQ